MRAREGGFDLQLFSSSSFLSSPAVDSKWVLQANQSSWLLIRKRQPHFALPVKEVRMSEQDESGTECGALGQWRTQEFCSGGGINKFS